MRNLIIDNRKHSRGNFLRRFKSQSLKIHALSTDYSRSRDECEKQRGGREGRMVNEHTSCVWTRMTQQLSSHPVASWWARRETSSVDSNYRYPTRTTPGSVVLHELNAIYMLQVLIALRGCDRSASFATGHEFVDTSTREGTGIGWYHRQIAGCSSNVARHTLICSVRRRSQSIKRDPICARPPSQLHRTRIFWSMKRFRWQCWMSLAEGNFNSKSYWSSINLDRSYFMNE